MFPLSQRPAHLDLNQQRMHPSDIYVPISDTLQRGEIDTVRAAGDIIWNVRNT